jgi:hypothetical protein
MGYLELAGWFVAAVGAALAVGTTAAWWTYRRTGSFPTSGRQTDGPPAEPDLRIVAAKVVLGVVVSVAGAAWAVAA